MSSTAGSGGPNDTVANTFMTNEDESDELFSDDESREINYRSDVSLDISVLQSETPLSSIDNSNAITPSNAVIPSTPLSLVPFLNKINEQWTSDLETPQADRTAQLHARFSTSAPKNTGETPKLEQHTPDISSAKSTDNKITSDSPVIVTRVVRKRPKRRCIFRSSISIDTSADISSENITVGKQEEAPFAAEYNTNLVAQDNVTVLIPHIDSAHGNKSQVHDRIEKIHSNENFNQLRDTVPDTLDLAKKLYNDASFSNIDKSFVNNYEKQATIDSTLQDNSKQDIVNTYREESQTLNLNKEEKESVGSFTAHSSISISKETLFKTKIQRLTDEVQKENHELLDKKNSVEQMDQHLSLSSEVLQDVKRTFANESIDKEDSMLLFSTANDVRSNVYEQTSSRVKLSFEKELDESLELNAAVEADVHNKENRLQEIENLSIGFQTARGAPINISKQALSKAKMMFAKELDESLENNVAEETNIHNKENRLQEIKNSNIGFQTARGVPINISKQALSKAKLLFTKELDEPLKINVTEEVNITNEAVQEQEVKAPSIGFQTAHDAPINISKQTLSKAKLLFAKELDEPLEINVIQEASIQNKEITTPDIGFQTARGAPINISKQALSRAKSLFAKELDEPLEVNVVQEANIQDKEVSTPNIGFQTAGGAPINISKQTLSKATSLFAQELNEPLEVNVVQEASIQNKEITTPDIGFQTARGAPINISKQALSRAKSLFAKELDEPLEVNVVQEANIQDKEVSTPNIGFQTARGAPINISKQALSKAKSLFAQELNEPLEVNVVQETSIQNKEITTPDIGFQTARGTPINISKQALSRAKSLFAKELDEPLEVNVVQEANIQDKEVSTPNIGFQTARGTPINISKQALSKAKSLFAQELNESLEFNIVQEASIQNKEITIPDIGFQTARGAPINISKQTLSRAISLFAQELDEPLEINVQEINIQDKEVTTSNIGFQTARGAPINISKQALSRAKSLFAPELDESLEINVAQEANIQNKEITTPDIGFQTARGTPINISKQALSRAKSLFAQELDEPLEINVQEINIQDEEVTTPNIGFQTARGAPINISKQALSRTKSLLRKELDGLPESNIAERSNINNETVRGEDEKVSNVEFLTARGAAIGVSEQAFSKAQALFADQLDSPAESCFPEKRKLTSDDSTPLGRGFASGWKKMRFSNEFEGRKLFADCSNAVDMDDLTETLLENSRIPSKMSVDDDAEDRKIETFYAESTMIAVNDMECSNEKNQEDPVDSFLYSPKRDASEFSEPDAMGSPVIGRQPALKKRWSLEQRRGKHDAAQSDQSQGNASTTIAPPRENAPVRREKTHEEESQRTMQTDGQKPESNSDYGDTQMMMDFIDESAQILQNRLEVALEQEEIITRKRRHKSKQSTGYLYHLKQTNFETRISLRDLGKGAPPTPRTCQELIDQRIPPNILAISAATSASYKLRCSDFYGSDVARSNVRGLELKDGARLIMDENGYVGVWEFLRAFLASPGVDPNLIPARWIENHYRWIVWKLASMDRMKFGLTQLSRALTPSHVMAQLKYRYDREIDRSQRPAIRRILEKDDVASKRMVLCVSSIMENSVIANSTIEVGKSPRVGVVKWKIELTDGWYSIPACIDLGMVKNVSTGKVREGTKLLVYGAELLNCDVACYPLEARADVCLKLHTNSTRRARWDLKLGYASPSGPIPVRLRDVCPSGGFIGKMTIVVARVYPMLYHEKSASGESVLRNAKSEEKAQTEYEQRCRRKAEAFYDKAEEDFQEEDLLTARSGKDSESSAQDELLRELHMKKERYKQQLQWKLRESLPAPRHVSPLLKVRVCDGNAHAILSIWSPGEEVVDALKEGACVSLRNVTAAGKRGCELQLTAGRCALFNPGTMRDTSHPPRVCASFREMASPEFSPPYGEFDTVGLVCAVGTAPYGMKDFEVAHLTYPKSDSSHSSSYLSIMFWQGIASYGYAEILTVGSVVACNNLEWRRATSWNVPVAYCTDKSTFTRNPRRNHLYEAFESLRGSITDPAAYAEGCTAELNVELQKRPASTRTPTRYAPDKNTPIKIYNSAPGSDKRPVDHTPSLSTPRSTAVNNSWSYVASSSSIQKRLDKLQYYAEPPELSPIVIRSSKRVSLDYRSPVRVSDANSTDSSSTNVTKSGSNSCLSPEKQ
ncbi:breast cancer type 2 susceptibility protein homolog isoform X2 [Odontomachus brunneus]|uniref:breast cancer type 2 susceptibility protein homolog isoform X2 n=1 Tax=Odontomachus brunneus TaxID=486640 RepID=UPI0013F20490|nr:breast cancer type 2 susceptibility protein homolog isoform X2 [Odontomachus brunneus]